MKKNNDSQKSFLPVSGLLKAARRFLLFWIIAALLAALLIYGCQLWKKFAHRQVSVAVNFSFDGIEAGRDPAGNKFDANEIKSRSAIKKALDELDIENGNIDKIYSSIHISGDVPSDVINRIIDYSFVSSAGNDIRSQNINDTAYYPTRYNIVMDCSSQELSHDECVRLLEQLTADYRVVFYEKYGYKRSIEDAMRSADYDDYDYIDKAEVMDMSLESMKNYIDELQSMDIMRFRSEKSGRTFSDLSRSIETIRTEDIEYIMSLVTKDRVTRDRKNLTAAYRFRIEELERQIVIDREKLDAAEKTVNDYQKNTVMIFDGDNQKGANIELSQSSDAYKRLIDYKVNAQKNLTNDEKQLQMYKKRMEELDKKGVGGSEEAVKEKFAQLEEKADKLLSDMRITVNEYYEDVLLKNAYEVTPVSSGKFFDMLLSAFSGSAVAVLTAELIIAGVFIVFCTAAVCVSEKKKRKGAAG